VAAEELDKQKAAAAALALAGLLADEDAAVWVAAEEALEQIGGKLVVWGQRVSPLATRSSGSLIRSGRGFALGEPGNRAVNRVRVPHPPHAAETRSRDPSGRIGGECGSPPG
jgi:hypothetical protein